MKMILGIFALALVVLTSTLFLWHQDHLSLSSAVIKDCAALEELRQLNGRLSDSLNQLDVRQTQADHARDKDSEIISKVSDERDRLQNQCSDLSSQLSELKQKNELLEGQSTADDEDTKSLRLELAMGKKDYDQLNQTYQDTVRTYHSLYADYQSLAALLEKEDSNDPGRIHYEQLSGSAAAGYVPSHAHTYLGTVITADGGVENVQGTISGP